MKKSDFIELVKQTGQYETKAEADKAIKNTFDSIIKVLEEGDSITIPRFATFKTSLLKGKTGTIPGKAEKYTTDSRLVPRFSPSKYLKDAVK